MFPPSGKSDFTLLAEDSHAQVLAVLKTSQPVSCLQFLGFSAGLATECLCWAGVGRWFQFLVFPQAWPHGVCVCWAAGRGVWGGVWGGPAGIFSPYILTV